MSLKQFFLALLLGTVLIQTGVRCARAEPPYRVVLEDEQGNALPTYGHRGSWFAQGRDGQRYNVRIYNNSARRVEAVVTVDGRDVLSGMPGDFKSQRGYLVPAYGSVLIEGFRTSLTDVAAFRFTSPDDSYSARMGTPENVGVVGAAFFPEAAPPRPRAALPYRPREPYSYGEYERGGSPSDLGSTGRARREAKSAPAKGSAGAAAPSAQAAPSYEGSMAAADREHDSSSNIGTEYGEITRSEVDEVQFTRAHPRSPERVITIRYDDREGLMARGILPRPQPRRQQGPEAFPVSRFAPPPPPRPYWY